MTARQILNPFHKFLFCTKPLKKANRTGCRTRNTPTFVADKIDQRSEERGQTTDEKRQRREDKEERTVAKDREQKAEDGGQRTMDRRQRTELRGQSYVQGVQG